MSTAMLEHPDVTDEVTPDDAPAEVDFDEAKALTPEYVYDAYRHADGSITMVVIDTDTRAESPREWDCNIAVIVQTSHGETDEDGIGEARNRFDGYGIHGTTHPTWGRGERSRHDREYMVKRYLSIFRPDVLHYDDWFSHGRSNDSHGYGYVMRDRLREHSLPVPNPANTEAVATWLDTDERELAKEAYEAEQKVFGQWIDGEVYGAVHVSVGDPIVRFWDHGAYVAGYVLEEDSCWGFLGYDDHKQIATQMTTSPITEVLH